MIRGAKTEGTQHTTASRTSKVRRIAILGGGVAALAAAFELTAMPGWRNRFDVTVYQMGWRLGGKGASGRRLGDGSQILEHGLHVWPGFYDNAFDLIKRCYEELGREHTEPLATWQDAFVPLSHVYLMEEVNGQQQRWRLQFPVNGRTPGLADPFPQHPAAMIVDLLRTAVDALSKSPVAALYRDQEPHAPDLDALLARAHAQVVTATMPLRANSTSEDENTISPVRSLLATLDNLVETLGTVRRSLPDAETATRRTALVIELGLCLARGLIADNVATRGFDPLDEEEWSVWMARHGADQAVLSSALVTACYDFAFAYRGGSPDRRSMAAGSGSRLLLRMIRQYKGSFFYKMRAGMGDVIFAPLYQVLLRRGVNFRFFHRVRSIVADEACTNIDQIVIGRQADVVGGEEAYRPLTSVRGLPCWPANPDFRQLVQAKSLIDQGINLESHWTSWKDVEQVTLMRGVHFDDVVLGISIGAFPEVCSDLIDRNQRWADMVEHVETIQTQAMQIWLRCDNVQLGWRAAPSVTTGFAKPFETWADMTHLEAAEEWGETPQMIGYFCGSLEESREMEPDASFPAREKDRVKQNANDWIQRNLSKLWPGFEPEQVIGTYYKANINPSDRYVLTVPGSTKYRMPPGDSGFDNLFLAGDWVHNAVNGGCVEGAALGGLEAGRSLIRRVGSRRVTDGLRTNPSRLAAEQAPLPWRLLHGVGHFNAAAIIIAVPAAELMRALPSPLQLARQSVTEPGLHPLGFMFSNHSGVRPYAAPIRGLSYREFVVVIPHVYLVGGRKSEFSLTYVAKMFVSSPVAMIAGIPYAFGKRVAQLQFEGVTYRVTGLLGNLLAQAKLERRGNPTAFGALPYLVAARSIMDQPMVTIDSLGRPRFAYSAVNFDEATYTPMEGTITVARDLLRGFNGRRLLPVDGIDTTTFGAFIIDADWTITNPGASKALARTLRLN